MDENQIDSAPAEEVQTAHEGGEGLQGAAAEPEAKAAPKFVGDDDEDEAGEPSGRGGNAVPQWRVNEIARERREAREEAARLRAEMDELRRQIPKPAVEDELDPKKFGSLAEYTAAVQAKQQRDIMEATERRLAERDAMLAQQAEVGRIASSFEAKLDAAKAENPDVVAARTHVDRLIDSGRLRIAPDIAREIMTHEDAPHLVYAIATDKALMKTIQSGDRSAILKAVYRFQHTPGAAKAAAADDSLTMETRTPAAPAKRPSAPVAVPAGGGGGSLPNDYAAYKAKRLGK